MNTFFNGPEKLEWLVTDLVLEIAALFDISEHGFSAILVGDESIVQYTGNGEPATTSQHQSEHKD